MLRPKTLQNFPAGDLHYGMSNSNTDNYQPYLGGVGPGNTIYFIDGQTGATSLVTAGYMNYGALNPDGSLRGFADGMYVPLQPCILSGSGNFWLCV